MTQMTKDEMIAELQEYFGINELGARDTVEALLNNDEIPCDAYDIFFDHYSDNGEMPYGTVTAHDGDPVEWVYNAVADHLGLPA